MIYKGFLVVVVCLLSTAIADEELKRNDGKISDESEGSLKISSILKSFRNIFKSGDAPRFATLNFVYQLACYSGITGPLLKKALWTKLRFDNYGCYCGAGNYNGNYLDATDKCCKIHDFCYYAVRQKYNLTLGCHTYLVSYNVSCCKEEKYSKCTDDGPSAGRELCECDQAMASCVAKSTSTYNVHYMTDHSNCRGYESSEHPGLTQMIKSCKHVFNPIVKLKTQYGSQGTCPTHKKKKSSWWGK